MVGRSLWCLISLFRDPLEDTFCLSRCDQPFTPDQREGNEEQWSHRKSAEQ
jgi:hypothetical protein